MTLTEFRRNNHGSSLFLAALSIIVCLAVVIGMGLLSGCQADPAAAVKDPVQATQLRSFKPEPLLFVNNKILYWKQDPREIAPGDLTMAEAMARMADIGRRMDAGELEIAPYTAQEDQLSADLDQLQSDIEELQQSEHPDPDKLKELQAEQAQKTADLQKVLDQEAPLKAEADRLKDESKELVRWTNIGPDKVKLSFKADAQGIPRPQVEIRDWQVNNAGATRTFGANWVTNLSYDALGGVLKFSVLTGPAGDEASERYEMTLSRTNYEGVPEERKTLSGDFTAYRRGAGGQEEAFAFGIAKFCTQH